MLRTECMCDCTRPDTKIIIDAVWQLKRKYVLCRFIYGDNSKYTLYSIIIPCYILHNIPGEDLSKLQRVQNCLARIVTRAPRFSRSIPILHNPYIKVIKLASTPVRNLFLLHDTEALYYFFPWLNKQFVFFLGLSCGMNGVTLSYCYSGSYPTRR